MPSAGSLFAPANTPKPIVDKWATEVRRAEDCRMSKRLADNGLNRSAPRRKSWRRISAPKSPRGESGHDSGAKAD